MWALGAQIPDGLIYGIVPTILGVLFSWGAWVTLLSTRTESQSKANRETMLDHEERLRDLEGHR